jgi:TrfB plasmid transcriptional repressor
LPTHTNLCAPTKSQILLYCIVYNISLYYLLLNGLLESIMQLADFIKITNSTRLAQHTKDAVRMVLVDGMRVAEAARQMEMSRQLVQNAVARVEAAHKAAHGIPENWECITLCVPPDLVGEMREIERKAKRAAGLSVD